MNLKIKLRDSQQRILDYQGGLMGISAVPGSGKTFTLSYLAAKLVLTANLKLDQEILIVTFSNSAADNFSSRIGNILSGLGFLEGFGYKVRTLHGLANDIIRERPDLAGLSNNFVIVDGVETDKIIEDIVKQKLEDSPDSFTYLLDQNLPPSEYKRVLEDDYYLPRQMFDIARAYISTCKDYLHTVNDMDELIKKSTNISPIIHTCQSFYRSYQDALIYRGGVDFDDLIQLALKTLKSDPDLLEALQDRWPFILEDEAQDSNLKQEEILSLLTSKHGNWVRVGDPNQAIYESFTTSNPELLKKFIARPDVQSENLPESGRSCLEIIKLANMLNEWTQKDHPNPFVQDALSFPLIQGTAIDDVQKNPESSKPAVEFINRKMNSEEELDFLSKAVPKWLNDYPNNTVAVLAFSNTRCGKIADRLKGAGVEVVYDLMKNSSNTMSTAGFIYFIIRIVLEPSNRFHLAMAFLVFNRHYITQGEYPPFIKHCLNFIKSQKNVEDFLYKEEINYSYLEKHLPDDELIMAKEVLENFAETVRKWHKAANLPLDQLIISVTHDFPLTPLELAISHKIAQLAKQLIQENPDWYVKQVLDEIFLISQNKRVLMSFNETQEGFNPEQHKGKVVVSTYHKSKGLEWDKVFLSSVNSYDFPSGDPNDIFLSEKEFFTHPKNKQAEIIEELKCLIQNNLNHFVPGLATTMDRNNVSRERLRVLYVGITRAKKSLTFSWNTGYKNRSEAIALTKLRERWQNENRD